MVLFIFFLISALHLSAQPELKGMEEFQTYLTRNVNIKNKVEVISENHPDWTRITLGEKTFYYWSVIGDPDCNGSFCVEQHYYVYDSSRTDSVQLWSWGYMGFFSDINNDKRLDFIKLEVTNKNIYEEDTFKVQVYSMLENGLEFSPLKDANGNEYYLDVYWGSGLFGENSNREVVKVIKQHWPFKVKF